MKNYDDYTEMCGNCLATGLQNLKLNLWNCTKFFDFSKLLPSPCCWPDHWRA